MENIKISAPVGVKNHKAHGNLANDVFTVQFLLKHKGFDPGHVNGVIDGSTIDAIVKFQSTFMSRATGRIDPHSDSLRRLTPDDPLSQPIDFVVPFFAVPVHIPAFTFRTELPIPTKDQANGGLRFASNTIMMKKFGAPRDDFDDTCKPPTNPKIAKRLGRTHVGRTPVMGFKPAIDSLEAIMQEIAEKFPLLHAHIGSAGMLCCRFVRGSHKNISNHSWGTAIDISIDGAAQARGAKTTWLGYWLMAPIFNAHGWNWGGPWPTPDPHHFECGADLIDGF